MKLPDFFESAELNSLKLRMGIPLNVYGSLYARVDPSRLTPIELERLSSSAGLEIVDGDLRVLSDHTLAYKNKRVLLYIRDVSTYGNYREVDPKFHIAHCRTLVKMREMRRFQRYVVSQSTTGVFLIHVIDGQSVEKRNMDLDVCKNCLDLLGFDGYSSTLSWPEKQQRVSGFKLERFFDRYPKSLHPIEPQFNSDNAPLNNYTPDWADVSARTKAAARWKCQNGNCGVDLSANHMQRFLHVHHIDGRKNNNHPANLRALCLMCHAQEPGHEHMKQLAEYQNFVSLRNRVR